MQSLRWVKRRRIEFSRTLSTLIIVAAWTGCAKRQKLAVKESRMNNATQSRPVLSYCLPSDANLVLVSEDSVGPLDLWMTLRSLKARCPAAYDTVSYGHETTNPAVVFPFHDLTAMAVQYQDSLLLDQPADAWGVTGVNGRVLSRVPLSAPWIEFRESFGPAIASGENTAIGENRVSVMFCSHPRLFLVLDAPSDSVAADRPADLSRIPRDAEIAELDVFPRPNPTWQCSPT